MTITTVAINCDIGLANATEFTASQLEFTLSQPDYDTVSNDSIPSATVIVSLDASGVATANLWPVDRGVRNSFYAVVLVGSRTINGRLTSERFSLGNIAPPSAGSPFALADLLGQSTGGIAVGSTIYATLADAVAAAVAAASTATTQAGIAATQAGTATTQAGIATTQAGNAANSATQAQNFATAAAAVGSTYPSVAAGIAAVANGAVFFVPIAGGIGLTVYQRSGASANVIGSVQGDTFDTRAAYTAWVAAGGVAVSGRTYWVGGFPFRGVIGATSTGLTGLVPHPRFPLTTDHFGENTTPGTTDMTAAIQAAVNYAVTATDKLVWLLPAIYFVSSTITINADGVGLMGDSEFSSTIYRTGNYGDTIFVTGNDATGVVVQSNEVSNIRFISAGLTTSGAHIHWNGTFKSNMRGVDFQNGFVAVRFSGATNMHVERVRAIWSNLFGGVVTGRRFFLFDSAASTYGHPQAGDVFIDSFNLRTNGNSPNVEVGCEIKSADGIWFVNGHYGGASLANFWLNAVDASHPVDLVFNSAVMFDANTGDGIRFSGSAQIGRNIYFAGCNLKGGAIGQYGINVVSGASFTNVNWNGGFITEYLLNGVLINSASAVNWTFTDVNIRGNSYNSPGTSHGVSVINGTSFQFLGGRYGGHNINQTPATQGYGITVGASASNVFVHGVDLRGNTVAPSLVNGSALNVKFSDCISDRTRTIASASTLDLPRELQTHVVTGTTTINNMTAQPEGSQVTLQFQAALSISGAGNLSPGTAITTAANQILTFQYDGTNWRRVT